jgi:RNA polymerase sigma factor for flagellar operon FliA
MNAPIAGAAPPLSEDPARALWEGFRVSRDARLREQLIEMYLPLARRAAARLFRLRADDSVPFADYLQYARIGLVEAVDGFDPGREVTFETYSSHRIRGAVLNGLGHETEISAQRSFWRTRAQERLDSLKKEPATGVDEELAALATMTMGLAIGYLLELEEVPDEAEDRNPYAVTELLQVRRLVRGAVEKLPDRERALVRRHYFEHCNFRTLAQELSVTPGRVAQLHAKALAQIRRSLQEPPNLDRKL